MVTQRQAVSLGILILVFSVIFTGCFPLDAPSRYKMPLRENGEVILYLQPIPQEAQKLRFAINEIYAVGDDGLEIPFTLFLDEVKGADLTANQKQLAAVVLPPGIYSGLSIHIKHAFLQTEEGDMALLVPDEPVRVDHGFDVTRRNASTLFISLNAAGNLEAGVRFTPGFSLASAARVLINLTGYVTNSKSNSISVFNKNTMQVVNTIATSQGPGGIVLDQLRTRAYVANSRDNVIEVIDVFKNKIINRLRLNLNDRPTELALTRDGRTLVSVNNGSNTVSIIDALSMIELAKVSVGEGPYSAVIDPSGFRAFVLNARSNTISVVDLTQRGVSLTIGLEGAPLRAAFDREGRKLFVIGQNTPNMLVIDLARLTVSEKVFIGMGAVYIQVDNQTDLIYVGKRSGGEIVVIDPFALVFIDVIRVAGQAAFMTIDEQERNLFVAIPDKNMLQRININSKKISANIDVGEGAYAVVVMGER
jgi:YVTN family beta-propeller protein